MIASPVRVQWDPERDLELKRLDYRTIQIGLKEEAVRLYLDRWIQKIEDLTQLTRRIFEKVSVDRSIEAAAELLPAERPYEYLPRHLVPQARHSRNTLPS